MKATMPDIRQWTIAVAASCSLAACGTVSPQAPDAGIEETASTDGGEESIPTTTSDPTIPMTAKAIYDPAPPKVGRNTMKITLTDANGYGVTGASITLKILMVSMGHGTNEVPKITDNGDGSYKAYPVKFTMPGGWRVTVTAKAGEATATAVVNSEVN